MQPGGVLVVLATELESQGYEARELRSLQKELDALDTPPGFVKRLGRNVAKKAREQWGRLLGELMESREAMRLIKVGVQRKRTLTPEESDVVRAQLVDLVKVFPAGLIAAANSAFPIPGTGLLTPWILSRLGLMPSRWREAHLLDRLHAERERLLALGKKRGAAGIERLCERLENDARLRARAQADAHLLTHWDANHNGRWDAEERAAYEHELARVKLLAERHAVKKRWFFQHEGEILGPLRLSEFIESLPARSSGKRSLLPGKARASAETPLHLLCCYDAKTGWVDLDAVRGIV